MRDEKAFTLVKTFAFEAVSIFQELAKKNGDSPTLVSDKFKVESATTISNSREIRIDWYRLVRKNEKEIEKLASYKKALHYLENTEPWSRQLNTLVGTDHTKRRLESAEILRIIIVDVLNQSELANQNIKLEELYKKIEEWFFKDIHKIRFFAPISNFSMDDDAIQISSSLSIVRISNKEKEDLLSSTHIFDSYFQILASREFAFEYFVDVPKLIGESNSESKGTLPSYTARIVFTELTTALRLFKPGLTGFNHIWETDTIWDILGNSITHSNGAADFLGERMHLNVKDIKEFLTLWQKYKKTLQRGLKKITNATDRLNFGTERIRPTDRMVDYFIGFESLFLNDKDPELNYRLSLYASHWIGASIEDRKRIFKVINKGYKQRSLIVHGGEPKSSVNINGVAITTEEHSKLIEDYLRSAINKFVNETSAKNATVEELIQELQSKILE